MATLKTFSISEIKQHNHDQSVWIVLHDKVYDVTKYITEHPGGEEVLLQHAGTNGTRDFEDVGHSSDARELMQDYYIGEVAEEDRQNETKQKEKSAGDWKGWIIPIGIAVVSVIVYISTSQKG